jgi:phospholipid transport system transporter-binding protein
LDALAKSMSTETTERIVVDATALKRFDSAALAVLLDVRRSAMRLGKSFALQGVPVRLQDLARLYGIDELLN